MSEKKRIPVLECKICRSLAIPPQYFCRKCGSVENVEAAIPSEGAIYSHTTIRVAPDKFRQDSPYSIAIVELAQSLRVTARIDAKEGESLKIGQKVLFDRIDERGYWFQVVG